MEKVELFATGICNFLVLGSLEAGVFQVLVDDVPSLFLKAIYRHLPSKSRVLLQNFVLDFLQLFFVVVGPISDELVQCRIRLEGHSQFVGLDILLRFRSLLQMSPIGRLFVSDDNMAFARNFYFVSFLLQICLTFANFNCLRGVRCIFRGRTQIVEVLGADPREMLLRSRRDLFS